MDDDCVGFVMVLLLTCQQSQEALAQQALSPENGGPQEPGRLSSGWLEYVGVIQESRTSRFMNVYDL